MPEQKSPIWYDIEFVPESGLEPATVTFDRETTDFIATHNEAIWHEDHVQDDQYGTLVEIKNYKPTPKFYNKRWIATMIPRMEPVRPGFYPEEDV